LALIARNKQLLGMLKSTKLTMILEQGKLKQTNQLKHDVKPVGELTSVEIEGMKAEEAKQMIK
jgi:hypothetical protein